MKMQLLSDAILELMQVLKVPIGLKVTLFGFQEVILSLIHRNCLSPQALGFKSDDVPALVKGSLPQHRVIKLSPRPVGAEELEMLFKETL